jgi:hypothetical protein
VPAPRSWPCGTRGLKANFGLGLALAERGEHELAREALVVVAEHPDASEDARSQAQAVLTSLATS